MGFTHVILGTGCQAYLGGLIEVNDFASMTLMILFYRNLKRDPRLSLAESLRQAQLEFIQMDKRKATRFLDKLLDRWDKIRQHEKTGEAFCPSGRDILMSRKSRLHRMDWASPHRWAPFTMMGYGGLTFGMHQRA
jgi:CHAT domain-containing protein